jgi:hypothetical protein
MALSYFLLTLAGLTWLQVINFLRDLKGRCVCAVPRFAICGVITPQMALRLMGSHEVK